MKFFPPGVSVSDPGVRQFGRLMGPSFFGMGVYQINLFIDTIFATSSRMPSGSITSLYVADRVMQLVLGSYAVAMSTVILPTMSHQLAAGQLEEMKRTFGFALRIVSFITIPAAVGLILLRKPIIQVLVSARAIRGGVDFADGERAALLRSRAAGVCGDQVDQPDVLLGEGYGDAREDRRLRAWRATSCSTRRFCCSRFATFRMAARRWPVRSRLISISCCCLYFFASATAG